MAEDTVVINATTVPNGAPIATFKDAALREHQEVVIQTQLAAADPVSVSSSNPLPTAVTSGLVQASADNSIFSANAQAMLPIAFAANDPPSAVTNNFLGMARMTPQRQQVVAMEAGTTGGASVNWQIAPATVAVRTVKASAGKVHYIHVVNETAAAVYLKFFDIASGSITLGATACTHQFTIPGNTGGAGFVLVPPTGIQFGTAINYCVSNLIAATDNTAITASKVNVNIGYQ
jgi:hypothetical protein